jgi:hypothetical protein
MLYIFGICYKRSFVAREFSQKFAATMEEFEQGGVLVRMNTMHKNEAITIKDGDESIEEGADYWDNPFQSAIAA